MLEKHDQLLFGRDCTKLCFIEFHLPDNSLFGRVYWDSFVAIIF